MRLPGAWPKQSSKPHARPLLGDSWRSQSKPPCTIQKQAPGPRVRTTIPTALQRAVASGRSHPACTLALSLRWQETQPAQALGPPWQQNAPQPERMLACGNQIQGHHAHRPMPAGIEHACAASRQPTQPPGHPALRFHACLNAATGRQAAAESQYTGAHAVRTDEFQATDAPQGAAATKGPASQRAACYMQGRRLGPPAVPPAVPCQAPTRRCFRGKQVPSPPACSASARRWEGHGPL